MIRNSVRKKNETPAPIPNPRIPQCSLDPHHSCWKCRRGLITNTGLENNSKLLRTTATAKCNPEFRLKFWGRADRKQEMVMELCGWGYARAGVGGLLVFFVILHLQWCLIVYWKTVISSMVHHRLGAILGHLFIQNRICTLWGKKAEGVWKDGETDNAVCKL